MRGYLKYSGIAIELNISQRKYYLKKCHNAVITNILFCNPAILTNPVTILHCSFGCVNVNQYDLGVDIFFTLI